MLLSSTLFLVCATESSLVGLTQRSWFKWMQEKNYNWKFLCNFTQKSNRNVKLMLVIYSAVFGFNKLRCLNPTRLISLIFVYALRLQSSVALMIFDGFFSFVFCFLNSLFCPHCSLKLSKVSENHKTKDSKPTNGFCLIKKKCLRADRTSPHKTQRLA